MGDLGAFSVPISAQSAASSDRKFRESMLSVQNANFTDILTQNRNMRGNIGTCRINITNNVQKFSQIINTFSLTAHISNVWLLKTTARTQKRYTEFRIPRGTRHQDIFCRRGMFTLYTVTIVVFHDL